MDANISTNLNSQKISHGIRGRLILGFSAIMMFLVIAIIIILYKVTAIETFSESVFNNDLPVHANSYALNISLNQTQNELLTWIITHDSNQKLLFDHTWNQIHKLESQIDSYYSDTKNQNSLKDWQELKSFLPQLKAAQEKIFTNPTLQNSTHLTSTIIPLLNKILDIIDGPLGSDGNRIDGLFDIQYEAVEKYFQEIVSNLATVRYIEYSLLILTLILSITVAYYTSKGIINYIILFRQHSAKVAAGDLTQRIQIKANDEMGQLGDDLNQMTESLANIAKQITEACNNMVSSITEVKHVVDVQSSGASEQASSINQITASLEEIEKSSNQTIEKAKALGQAAERTREKGQLGLDAVEQSVSGMKSVREKVEAIAQTILDLSNQTQQVGEITAVVNTLAQQSKMLALNASIEAAKAGEAGKGFAVVASEVKNLAEQSEQSTTQVQKILEDIRRATEKAVMATEEGTKGVDFGTKLVEQTGDIVRNLSDVIYETTIASQQIEAAIRQEGIGIEQITAGMNEINQVTASFVDSVNQTTEAVGNLASIVQNLKQYTEFYHL